MLTLEQLRLGRGARPDSACSSIGDQTMIGPGAGVASVVDAAVLTTRTYSLGVSSKKGFNGS